MFEQTFPCKKRNLWWCVFILGFVIGELLSQRVVMAEDNVPTTITSKTMAAFNKDRKAIFRGSVVLTQGALVVRSDIMIVWFKEKDHHGNQPKGENPDRQRIERIVAKGRVVIEKAKSRATCRNAVYYKDKEEIVLTGSPVAWQEGTRVNGPKMTMYLKENRSIVEGGSKVVIMEDQ